jgi:hypothetical protein
LRDATEDSDCSEPSRIGLHVRFCQIRLGPKAASIESRTSSSLADAEALLDGVLQGGFLRQLSENHEHWPSWHDTERAELTVKELERLGVVRP